MIEAFKADGVRRRRVKESVRGRMLISCTKWVSYEAMAVRAEIAFSVRSSKITHAEELFRRRVPHQLAVEAELEKCDFWKKGKLREQLSRNHTSERRLRKADPELELN